MVIFFLMNIKKDMKSKKKILVIDDDPYLRLIMNENLAYNIVSANSKKQVEKIISKKNSFEVIFLDVKLGQENGFELVSLLREYFLLTPIIILTAFPSKEIIVEALESKVDAFIEKPIDFNFLQEKLDELIIGDNSSYNIIIESICNHLKSNPEKSLDLESYAKKYKVNYKTLSIYFKNQIGVSFRDYKSSIKLDFAKKLLIETTLTINEIAYKLNYINPNSFMRTFKQYTAQKPSEFRRESKEIK